MVCEPASFATTFIFIGFHLTIEVVLRACTEVRALMSDEWELGLLRVKSDHKYSSRRATQAN